MRDVRAFCCVSLAFFCALATLAAVPLPSSADDGEEGIFSIGPKYDRYTIDITNERSVNITVVIKNLQIVPDTADVYCYFSYIDDQRTFIAQTDRMGAGGEDEVTFMIDLRSEIDAGTMLPVNFTVKKANEEGVEDAMIIMIRFLGYYGFEIGRPVLPDGELEVGGFVSLPVKVMNTGNVNYAARLTFYVDGEEVAFATEQVSPRGAAIIDVAWDDPTKGEHMFKLIVQALLGYTMGDIDDPVLSETLDVYEFTVSIEKQDQPFNWLWVLSGLVAVLLVIIVIVAIKIKRNDG